MRSDLEQTLRTVSELMTREVVTIGPDATLQQVIAAMVGRGIRHLPILDQGKLAAIVSDRNIRVMVAGAVSSEERRRYLTTTSVMAHATRPVTTIGPDATAADAARVFVEQRIGCLPVVDDDGRLVGIVTQTDLLSWLSSGTL
jgi:CBS domain-containing protein